MDEVPCVIASGLTDEQIKALRLADNKVGELAEWDEALLNIELDELLDFDMSDFGFDFDVNDEENNENEKENSEVNLKENFELIIELNNHDYKTKNKKLDLFTYGKTIYDNNVMLSYRIAIYNM